MQDKKLLDQFIPLNLWQPLKDAQRLTTVEILDEGKTPAKVDELAAIALYFARTMARSISEEASPDRPLACKEGCHWCCCLVVEVTAVEVFAIARHLRP